MFFLRQPSESVVRALIDDVREQALTYSAVGATANQPPPEYNCDRYGVELGRGSGAYARAKAAVSEFAMYPPRWTRVVRDPGPVAEGFVFASLIQHLGFWSANPGRVVYILEDGPETLRSGFAFGTLPGHAERGEERFEVSWNRSDDQVRFDVVAFSRPDALLARLGAPIARCLQRRFRRDACAAMVERAGTGHVGDVR